MPASGRAAASRIRRIASLTLKRRFLPRFGRAPLKLATIKLAMTGRDRGMGSFRAGRVGTGRPMAGPRAAKGAFSPCKLGKHHAEVVLARVRRR